MCKLVASIVGLMIIIACKPLSHHCHTWHLSLVDTCRLVGTVHLHRYWLLVRFPSTKARGITGVVYLTSHDFLLHVQIFVKYTSRVNSMTLIHLVSFAMHNFWRVSQMHHSWNAHKRLPVKFCTGLYQNHTCLGTVKSVILDKCVYSMSFGRGVHKTEKMIGYYDVYQNVWRSDVKPRYLSNYCT